MPKDGMITDGFAAGAAAASGGSAGRIDQYAGEGRVVSVNGKAVLTHAGDSAEIPVTVGMTVHSGDVIRGLDPNQPANVRLENNTELNVTGTSNALVVADTHQTPAMTSILSTTEHVSSTSSSVFSSFVPPSLPTSVSTAVSATIPTIPTITVTAVAMPAPTLTAVNVSDVTAVAASPVLHAIDMLAPAQAEAIKYMNWSSAYHPVGMVADATLYHADLAQIRDVAPSLYAGVYNAEPAAVTDAAIADHASPLVQADAVATRFVPLPLELAFNYADTYNTPVFRDSTGIGMGEFDLAGSKVGTFALSNAHGPVTYAVSFSAIEALPTDKGDGSWTPTRIDNTAEKGSLAPFTIDDHGNLTVNNPLILSSIANEKGINLTVTAMAGGHEVTTNVPVMVQDFMGNDIRPEVAMNGNLVKQDNNKAELLVNFADNATTLVGTHDIGLIRGANATADIINSGFDHIVGDGTTTIGLGLGKADRFDMDFTKLEGTVTGVNRIEFGQTREAVTLDIATIFNLNSKHEVTIFNANGALGEVVNLNPEGFDKGTTDNSTHSITYRGTYHDEAVTLVISSLGGDGGTRVVTK